MQNTTPVQIIVFQLKKNEISHTTDGKHNKKGFIGNSYRMSSVRSGNWTFTTAIIWSAAADIVFFVFVIDAQNV